MVAYSFKERFRLPILAGTKCQTIRADRKRHARPGEELQLYTGMRTKYCDLIARAPCIVVEPIRIRVRATTREPCSVETPSKSSFYRACALDAFARSDGFDDWSDMIGFWEREHPDIEVFSGVLVMWRLPQAVISLPTTVHPNNDSRRPSTVDPAPSAAEMIRTRLRSDG